MNFEDLLDDNKVQNALGYLREKPYLEETYEHSMRVGRGAFKVGLELALPEEKLLHLAKSVVHDIGKVLVPEEILTATKEWDSNTEHVLNNHTIWGEQLLKELGFRRMQPLIALGHHSFRYTEPLPMPEMTEEESSLVRIVSVVDTFDALAHDRCYRSALPYPVVRGILVHEYGIDDVLDATMNLFDSGI